MTKVFTQDMAKRMVAYEIKTPFGSSSLGLAIPERALSKIWISTL